MSDIFFNEYLSSYNSIVKEINEFDFAYKNTLFIPISGFGDIFHDKLAAYHISNRINDTYSRSNIKSRLTHSENGILIYKESKEINIKKIVNKIISKINDKFRQDKAA